MSNFSSKPKYQDGRRNNGGARSGAGRPRNPVRLAREKQFEELALQEILIPVRANGQVRYKKVTILQALLDSLFESAFRDKNIRAAKLYLDTTLGKAVRPSAKRSYREDASKYSLIGKITDLKYGKEILEAYRKRLAGMNQSHSRP